MLSKDAWKPWEPRFGFPTFMGLRTLASFSIRSDFKSFNLARFPGVVKHALRQGLAGVRDCMHEYGTMLVSGDVRGRLRFRIIVTSRKGEMLGVFKVPESYPPGGSIDIDVTDVIEKLGLPRDNYMATLVMSRGRTDGFRSSPGSYSMTYIGDQVYTTYRTGGFARILNDPTRKRHAGFRGINPKAIANNRFISSLLLINHSSNPSYDESATPHSLLLRADGAMREATFGVIPPFGGVERSLEELFGKDVSEFLAPFGGRGTTITSCPGVTLASLHLMRARDGSSMSIEHSRPTHTYLLHDAV